MALNKSLVLDKGRRQAPVGVVFLHPALGSHPLVSQLFLPLAVCQGFPKLSKRAGLGLPTPGSPWSLQAGVKKGIREGSRRAGRLLQGSKKLAPSTRLPLSRDCIPGLPSLGLARSQLLSSPRLPGRALVGLGRQPGRLLLPLAATPPAPPPNCATTPGPIPAWGSPPGLRWGLERSGCSKTDDRAGLQGPAGLGARPWGRAAAVGGPGGQRLARAPPRTRRLRRGGCARSVSREHKQGEEAGVSAWAPCQRAGAGTQCPGRAGGRAGNENSLTQQLGKWVCARSPDQPLLQPAVSDDRLSEAPSNGRGELTAGSSAPAPACRSLRTSTWPVGGSLCLLAPPFKCLTAPSLSRAGSGPLGGALSSPHPAGVASHTAAGCPISSKPHHSGSPLMDVTLPSR